MSRPTWHRLRRHQGQEPKAKRCRDREEEQPDRATLRRSCDIDAHHDRSGKYPYPGQSGKPERQVLQCPTEDILWSRMQNVLWIHACVHFTPAPVGRI